MCRYKHLERLGQKARDRKKINIGTHSNVYFLQVVHVPFGDNAQQQGEALRKAPGAKQRKGEASGRKHKRAKRAITARGEAAQGEASGRSKRAKRA